MHCLDRATRPVQDQGLGRALDVGTTTGRARPERRHAHRPARHRRLDGPGDPRGAGGPGPGLPDQAGGRDGRSGCSPDGGAATAAALRGDCHLPLHLERRRGEHRGRWPPRPWPSVTSTWCLTDHSARLTIAHGLNRERLLDQLDELAALNERLAPFRILTGMEVDILEDGQLDLDDDLLARLDVVVASVHSKLRMERQPMTERMVLAVAIAPRRHPRPLHRPADRQAAGVDLRRRLRVRGLRPLRHGGRDQLPARAARPAAGAARRWPSSYGCFVSIDSDAHATGQLEWQPHGCEKAAASEVPIERIINTWPADDLLAWTAAA